MNAYAQWVKRKLDDPATPTDEYVKMWNEWQAILFQQRVVDAMGAERQREMQLANGWISHTPVGIINHTQA